MTENITQDMLEKVIGWMEATESVVAEQVPLLCQEIILRGKVDSGLGLLIFALFTIAAFRIIPRGCKKIDKGNDELGAYLEVLLGVLLGVFGGMGTIFAASSLIEVLCSPRLYIIHELQRLM